MLGTAIWEVIFETTLENIQPNPAPTTVGECLSSPAGDRRMALDI